MDTNGKQIRKTRTWKPAEAMTEKKADKLAKEKYIEFKNQCKDLSDFNDCNIHMVNTVNNTAPHIE